MELDLSLPRLILEWVDKEGPFEIDTQMVAHGGMRGDTPPLKKKKLKSREVMMLGEVGKKITRKDVIKFLDKLEKYVNDPAFDSGRAYIFEGIRKVKGKRYIVLWGS